MTLDEIKLGSDVKILSVNNTAKNKSRLMEMGFVREAIVTPVFSALLSEPRAYLINGAIIALRREDARMINVTII